MSSSLLKSLSNLTPGAYKAQVQIAPPSLSLYCTLFSNFALLSNLRLHVMLTFFLLLIMTPRARKRWRVDGQTVQRSVVSQLGQKYTIWMEVFFCGLSLYISLAPYVSLSPNALFHSIFPLLVEYFLHNQNKKNSAKMITFVGHLPFSSATEI